MVKYAVDAGTPESNIRVIPNGIPLADEHNFEEELTKAELSPGSDPIDLNVNDGIIIMSLSSGRKVKNLCALVEAFSLAKPELGDSKLLLACVGPLADGIHRMVEAKKLGQHVRFIGEVTGPIKHQYFLRSDVYCLTSYFESLGIVALEAMKYGTSVVATPVGGITDIVENGKNGLLVLPTDPQGIASALVDLYRNPSLRKMLVANGLETVKRYSISTTIDKYVALYSDVLHAAMV